MPLIVLNLQNRGGKLASRVSKFKLGHMGPNGIGFGSKKFLGLGPVFYNVGPPENLSITKF